MRTFGFQSIFTTLFKSADNDLSSGNCLQFLKSIIHSMVDIEVVSKNQWYNQEAIQDDKRVVGQSLIRKNFLKIEVR